MTDASREARVLIRQQTPAEPVRPGLERRILRTAHLMSVVIDLTGGPAAEADPPHSHPHEQTSYVAAGEILLLVDGQPRRRLQAGDLFAIPGGVAHSIQLLSAEARLVDTFYPVREDFLR